MRNDRLTFFLSFSRSIPAHRLELLSSVRLQLHDLSNHVRRQWQSSGPSITIPLLYFLRLNTPIPANCLSGVSTRPLTLRSR